MYFADTLKDFVLGSVISSQYLVFVEISGVSSVFDSSNPGEIISSVL